MAMASILAALVIGALGAAVRSAGGLDAGSGSGSAAASAAEEYADAFDAWMAEAAREMRLGRTPELHTSGFSYKQSCEVSCGANEASTRAAMERFELSSAARPTREFWNEEAVLRAMHSESEEPSFEDFYNRGLPIDEPLPVARYSLAELGGWESGRLASLLRSGVPVVISDAYASLPDFFRYSWTCEDFERRFGGLPGGDTSLSALYRGSGFTAEDQRFADFFRLLEGGSLYWGAKMRPDVKPSLSALLRNDEGVFGLPPDDVYRTSCVMASTPEFWFQRK